MQFRGKSLIPAQLIFSHRDAIMEDKHIDASYEFSSSAQPVVAAWRGRFDIPRQNLNINIAAHASNEACLEVASIMPKSLCLEIIPRINGRDEEVFGRLLTYAICGDFALKAMIGKAELLIFTSLQLPVKLHRIQGKPYLWGVFNGQPLSDSHQSEHQLHIQTPIVRLSLSANSCGQRSFDGTESPITNSSDHSPHLTQIAKAERRGRRLDDAWQHAKPLDALRQKAECKFCGFVSSHGGISRLKAHLGGGHPKIRLQGCDKVSPEVKKVMGDWFNEWVKKTKALWTKEIRAETAAHDERERPHAAAWEGSKTNFKYFSFDFSRGEVSHHKVSGGGDTKSHVKSWPQMLPETKGAMSVKVTNSTGSASPESKIIMSEWGKGSTASTTTESEGGEQSDKRGRPLDNAWQHAKPLDEARQKTQCNHCGFISMYGGISRLKAHLGGGCAEMQLQGCPQVPLEIQRVMEEWFNEWVKYSTATWTRKSGGKPSETHEKAPSAKSLKKGRPLEDTWEHGIPLDEMKTATKCNYCGFVSKCGGVSRLRAHLGGGDITMQLEGCPYVPPEVKSSMAVEGKKKYRKKSKAANMETAGGMGQGIDSMRRTASTACEAHWFERRHHILQQTLNGVSNTCLKESLQKLIHEKNADLQKMQFEIYSLENRLASMP
ncbi:hypothetical protein OROMI_030580 [Orobanche minor]